MQKGADGLARAEGGWQAPPGQRSGSAVEALFILIPTPAWPFLPSAMFPTLPPAVPLPVFFLLESAGTQLHNLSHCQRGKVMDQQAGQSAVLPAPTPEFLQHSWPGACFATTWMRFAFGDAAGLFFIRG